ncbi:hypothetical protein PR202_gb25201 [Eleusine coracana subsp. coracana]|uniref:Uncharacterized protein n=1 Tax=Eleusine coracana subsp. coracana TaxID=191504 RepID=A0AAV5FNK8_ELECO|nr:hypothetical protein PR202_gb25201 [Eleusine coracana subsp. coracana]
MQQTEHYYSTSRTTMMMSRSRSGEQQHAPSSTTCELIAAVDDVPINHHHHHKNKPGKAVTASVYRAKIAGHSRVVTVSWSRDLLSHAFSVSISGADGAAAECRVDLRPWQFWRRTGSRRLDLAGATTVRVLWDLRRARFSSSSSSGGSGAPEPKEGYFVAVEAGGEVVLIQGDMRRAALRRASCGAAEAEAVAVARREHVFGRRRFAAKARFHERDDVHDVAIECSSCDNDNGGEGDMEMRIAIDGEEAVQVKHLQWKFRGNQSVTFLSRAKVEVYWDVHDWLFSAGTRPALFIFRPIVLSTNSAPAGAMLDTVSSTTTGFCLYLYAWKLD